jgi:hypothetical protein
MKSFRLRILAQVLPFLLITPGIALAQAPPSRAQATAAAGQPNKPAAAQYNRQQIDQMVAPIALYPDQLLTQVLMAATYPTQIVEAAEWLQKPENAELKGDALVAALQPFPWDPSVKALVAFPQIVVMLSEHVEWTETLGVAFASQQAEVMARVQALRRLAVKSGHIKKMRQLAVREEGPVIVIAPAEPDRIFVPVYNPVVVYGAWPERDYPPVFIPPPPRFVAETIAPGIEVSVGFGIVAPLWGWSRPDWRSNQITINRVEYTRITNNVNVQIGPGDSWRRTGPVVLAAPAATPRAPAAASVPAGTVAPKGAAAVVSLPQKAASQPALIKTQTATEPGSTQPGKTQATTSPPATAQPGQTTAGKPTTQQPGTAQTPAQPGTAQTGPAKEGTAKPSTAQTGPAKEGTAKPSTAQTGPAKEGAAKPSTAQTRQPREDTAKPSTAQTGTTQPEQQTAPTTTTRPGKAPGTAGAPAANQAREPAPAPSAGRPAGPGAAKSTRDEAGVKAPSGAREQMPRTPGQGGPAAAAPPAAPPAATRGPEQVGAKPAPGQPPGQAHQRPAPDAARQGSSAPPSTATPPSRGPQQNEIRER